MPEVSVCHMDDAPAFARVSAVLCAAHPELVFDRFEVNGEAELRSAHGGMRIFWLYRGEGEVFLPGGYRTKEGDGNRLPDDYSPEPTDPKFAATLKTLQAGLDSIRTEARPAIEAILMRQLDDGYVGDYANDLWKLEHAPQPWSADKNIERAIESLWAHCDAAGWSRKRGGSFERIMEGDQLIAVGDEALRVRGTFACLTIEKPDEKTRHVPSVMRLRYLRDSSGGCNFDFDPFRRLPLTWRMERPGERGDGANFVNSHVVNIAKETSPSHFHPPTATGGGKPQNEIYLVLDPGAYGLSTYGRQAQLLTWPNLRELSRCVAYDLKPGDFVHIPPGIGHRGIDVFVNVLTIPGFKPHNEYYIDADLRDYGNGCVFNESLVGIKNYATLADLLN